MSLFTRDQGFLRPEPKSPVPERLDLHNSSVDKTAAAANLCGMLSLRDGRVCVLPLHHPGGCHFVSRATMRTQLGI